ncbi:hypothetical protein ACWKWA_05750 [Dermacoccus abyssi]|jgi:hypothetical protein|uniref:hypothetical protein n=1 Tax=Dermacoccus sp. PE3 TaxID=1641401 RepID=UPI000AF4BD24|nr:hypothetical protein [Dermacoccus sp. PE3]
MSNSPRLRVFLLGLAGVTLGIALAKLSGGSLAAVVAIVLALICFVLLRMRTGR